MKPTLSAGRVDVVSRGGWWIKSLVGNDKRGPARNGSVRRPLLGLSSPASSNASTVAAEAEAVLVGDRVDSHTHTRTHTVAKPVCMKYGYRLFSGPVAHLAVMG